jgi:hypothetical protein
VSDNPYAPSSVADAAMEAPRSRGWELVEGKLLVEPEAVLPMIDPYTGETADRMTLMRIALRPRALWPRFLFMGGFSLMIFFGLLGFPGISAFMYLPWVIGFIGGVWTSLSGSIVVHVFLTERTHRKRRLVHWLLFASGLLAFVLLLVVPNVPQVADQLGDVVAALWFTTVLVAILVRWLRRRLYCRRSPDRRFEMRGLHPRAMELLEATAAGQRA